MRNNFKIVDNNPMLAVFSFMVFAFLGEVHEPIPIGKRNLRFGSIAFDKYVSCFKLSRS